MPKSSSFISHLNFAEPTFNSPIFAKARQTRPETRTRHNPHSSLKEIIEYDKD